MVTNILKSLKIKHFQKNKTLKINYFINENPITLLLS